MTCINYDHDNRPADGKFGGAMCFCSKCSAEREKEYHDIVLATFERDTLPILMEQCEHGGLKRACPHCENAELVAENQRLRAAIEDIRGLATTEHESKSQFVSRVLACLRQLEVK